MNKHGLNPGTASPRQCSQSLRLHKLSLPGSLVSLTPLPFLVGIVAAVVSPVTAVSLFPYLRTLIDLG